jgi:hypothetical protein
VKLAQVAALVAVCALAYCPVHASAVESYHYEESIGGSKKEIQWCVDKSAPIRLLYQTNEVMNITETDESSATIQWEMERLDEYTSLHVFRRPHAIIIEGRWKGHKITRELPVDEAPWYQATSWSLRSFVLSSQKEIRFWTVRADTLSAYKIKAVKKRRMTLNLNGTEEEAVEVELRLEGLMALFWKSSYWFRQSDGVFLRFKGPSGPPGAPEMVVEYRGPATPCKLGALDAGAIHLPFSGSVFLGDVVDY